VLGGTDTRPYEISAVEPKALRQLTDHNAFLATKALAPAEEIRFKSNDGTEIEALLVKPPGYEPASATPRCCACTAARCTSSATSSCRISRRSRRGLRGDRRRIPRGSSGRGLEFARAIRADWGHKDVEDVLAAVDHVAALGSSTPRASASAAGATAASSPTT
jgi:hypothetical protein